MWKPLLLIGTGLALSLTSLQGCSGGHKPSPVEPEDTHLCEDACARMRALTCPEGDPLSDGTSCTQFCEDTQRAGHALNVSCLVSIQTCEEIITTCAANREGL